MQVNVCDATGLFTLKPIEMSNLPKEVSENIAKQFKKTDEEAATVELSSVGKKLSIEMPEREKKVLETTPLNANKPVTYMPRTGYEAIDNKLVDSLKNVSEDVKQSVYGIIRQDMLRGYDGGMSESERQDRISFGLAEAQYLADNYMGKEDADKFMTAMKKIAGIAQNGTADKNGKMTYDMPGNQASYVDKNGYTVETTDTIGMMKKYDSDKYNQWKELQDKFGETGDEEYLKASMKVSIQFVLDNTHHPERVNAYENEQKSKVANLSDKNVRKTFEKVDTKDFDSFMNSLKAIQNQNMNLQNNWFSTRYNDLFKSLQNLK